LGGINATHQADIGRHPLDPAAHDESQRHHRGDAVMGDKGPGSKSKVKKKKGAKADKKK